VKPEPTCVLEATFERWMTELAPSVEPAYRRASLGMEAILLLCLREEWERAAARRVEENEALRRLFADAAQHVEDPDLRERLATASAQGDPDLHVAALQRANEALRALLIELQAHVEERRDAQARRLEAAIWSELRASTERRRFSVSPF
jgi:hypothetical protein